MILTLFLRNTYNMTPDSIKIWQLTLAIILIFHLAT